MEPSLKKLCTEAAIISVKNDVSDKTDTAKVSEENDVFNNSKIKADDLNCFEINRVLNVMEDRCSIVLEGTHKTTSNKAIIILQKLSFSKEKVHETFSKLDSFRTVLKNDIYHNQMAQLPKDLNEIKVNVTYPAQENHIKKFERQTSSFIIETPELYKKITFPFMESSSNSKQWIYNILEHKKEADRIVCEDLDPMDGFILVPDLKWTGEQMENLYLQAIIVRRDVLSIRDLKEEHLPLLKNIYEKCTKTIKDKYNVPNSKLRIYFHYQPSFYHLHVHFSALSFETPGIWAGKAHLLQEVISNIESDSEYYQKATIPFTIKDNHHLRTLYEKEGYFENN